MATAAHDLSSLPPVDFADAGLFALIDELRRCEKRRDDLLAAWSSDHSDQVRPMAEKACNAARAIYEQIAATKPTTAAGVLRQLELAAKGWVGAPIMPIAMAALREIADRPPPFKAGKLPPVPRTTNFPMSPAIIKPLLDTSASHSRAARPDGDVRLGSMISAFAPHDEFDPRGRALAES
jgi:hypothetical protein